MESGERYNDFRTQTTRAECNLIVLMSLRFIYRIRFSSSKCILILMDIQCHDIIIFCHPHLTGLEHQCENKLRSKNQAIMWTS